MSNQFFPGMSSFRKKQMLPFHLIKFNIKNHVRSNANLSENDRIVWS